MKILDIVLLLVAAALFSFSWFGISYIESNTNNALVTVSEDTTDLFSKSTVYLAGGVSRPGIYEIETGETYLYELVERAGGFSPEITKQYVEENINLAKLVKDQEFIYIGEISGGSSTLEKDYISINNATLVELTSISGIGEKTASKILEGRPYSNLEDLLEVEGIGEKTLESIRSYISL